MAEKKNNQIDDNKKTLSKSNSTKKEEILVSEDVTEKAGVEENTSSFEFIGNELKAARLEKKLSIKKISEDLNIKVSQLEAIEKGDLENLPEMIYAAGFVRNYAEYLGIDSKYASERFKEEHCKETKDNQDFSFPEPLYENSVPGPTLLGICAFLSILVLISWAVYSNMDINKADMVKSGLSASKAEKDSEDSENILSASSNIREPEFVETNIDIKKEKEKERTVAVTKEEVVARDMAEKASVKKIITSVIKDINKKTNSVDVKEVDVKVVETNKPIIEDVNNKSTVKETVRIKKKVAAVVLKAKEASWIQVTDGNQKVIFRKVLRPGDEYIVPNKKNLSLVTANAGGLEVYVYGNKVQSIGKAGEIVRGVILDPEELKLHRVKSRR